MRLWFRRIRGEWTVLFAQPRVQLGFGACVLVELLFAALFQLPTVRTLAQGDLRRAHVDLAEAFSGLTMAAHLLGETAMLVGSFFIALVAGAAVAGEWEDRTLRMILCRPISRFRFWQQRLGTVLTYTLAMSIFMAITSLLVGLVVEGSGGLVMLLPLEGVFGEFNFSAGLRRYALAAVLLTVSLLTVALLAFATSCFRIKPATATALALTLLLADGSLRRVPTLAMANDYFLTTRLIAWLHAFDATIPWGLLGRSYTTLLTLDAALLAVSLVAFCRLETRS